MKPRVRLSDLAGVDMRHFETPRLSQLPVGYFDPWWKRVLPESKELIAVLFVLFVVVAVIIK